MRYKPVYFARYVLQVISLALFLFLFTYLIYPLEWQASILQWFSRLDPWGLLSRLRWQHTIPVWVWLPGLTVIATLLFGRVFCGWLCPFGALMMLVDKISRILFKNKSFKKMAEFRTRAVKRLLPIRYFWLLFLVITYALGVNIVAPLTPFALFSHEIVRIFQRSVPWLLIAIVIMTIFFSRLWCSVFCPTGVLLSFIGRLRLFRYQTTGGCIHCKKCGYSCPVGAEPDRTGVAGEGCLTCGECQAVCPTKAVGFRKEPVLSAGQGPEDRNDQGKNSKGKNVITRRQFLELAGVFVIGLAASFWHRTVRITKKVLRPPGALEETKFRAVCNRCGRCIQVCPNNALRPMAISEGIDSFETPYIIAREANCSLCLSCQEVCPTGAVAKVPVEQVKMGLASIDKSTCLAWSQDKFCFICGEQCLRVAISIDELNRPTVQPNICAGCGTCERNCPVASPAIRVTPR
ncbi:MAG TPA: 4Fe-4S dicluster domain-containing protein [Mobilitalea sp.]|nr:4Fe-4S dicluster domain-containing protein [Mobilitalea sp.]